MGQNRSQWFATGRDALAAVALERQGLWLVPEFTCPVVPQTLARLGCRVRPYPWRDPWQVDDRALRKVLPKAVGIVVPYFMGLPPHEGIWTALEGTESCVVEDRCQTVGFAPTRSALRGDFAIGSFRKWFGTPDGAYCVARRGKTPRPTRRLRESMVRLRLAAALLKHARGARFLQGAAAESTQIALFRAGEQQAEEVCMRAHASTLATMLASQVNSNDVRRRRIENQRILLDALRGICGVRVFEPEPGALADARIALLGVPVLCDRRDDMRRYLAAHGIYCAVHWSDGNWSGRSVRAAGWARSVLTLPSDQRYRPDDMLCVADVLKKWKS